MTVSGPDRVGVGAELFAALTSLESRGLEITDVAQITIRGALVLCAEVSSRNTVSQEVVEAALAQRNIVSEGDVYKRQRLDWWVSPAPRSGFAVAS